MFVFVCVSERVSERVYVYLGSFGLLCIDRVEYIECSHVQKVNYGHTLHYSLCYICPFWFANTEGGYGPACC